MGRAAQGAVRSNRGGDPIEGGARPRDGHATLREIVPWHVEPAKSEPPPTASPSGIRLVEPPPEVREALAAYEASAPEVLREVVTEEGAAEPPASSARARAAVDDAPLSFQVYTLADLDARRPDADPANRMSRLMFEAQPRPPSPWATARARAWELAADAFTWAIAFARTRVRPSAEPLRLRLLAVRQSLVIASSATDWKRVSTLGGMSLGAVVALLAIVLTVADLTDDLKPARSAREPESRAPVAKVDVAAPSSTKAETAASAETAGKSAQPEPAKVVVSPAPEVSPAPAPAPAPAIELDDAAPAPVRAAKAAPRGGRPVAAARKPAPAPAAPAPPTRSSLALSGTPIPGSPLAPNAGPAPRTRGGTKLSFRDADEVFRP